MQFTSAQKRTITWCLIAAMAILALWLLGPVLTPFVVAAVLAYVLTPVVNKLDDLGNGRLPRVVAVLIVESLFILILLSILLLVVPIFAKELPLLREQLPLLAARVNNSLGPWLAQFGIKLSLDVESIKTFVVKYLNANVEDTFGSLVSSLKLGGSVALAIIGNVVLIPVALFFLLTDWDRLVGLAIG
ncbi:MAG: AI-2E family transporter, partial [Rhodoferax sp.]|nr:AI-2E family transporter [Rhodoferax sp.]